MTVPAPALPFRPSGAQLGLIAANFLMWGGFFAVIPLVTVHFVEELGWAAASVGLVLGLRQLTQQGLTVFGGAWADRIGPKPLILAGCLIRTLGFAWMGFAETLPVLLAASVLAGLGGGLFDAPKNAAITAVTRPEHRTRMFSLTSISGNLGMVTGPLIGAALLGLGFRTAAFAAGSVYLVAAAVLAVTLPHVKPEGAVAGGLAGLRTAARDRRFRRFTLVLVGYFLLSTQLNVAVTLKAVSLAGPGATGPLYGLSAGLAVVLQYPLLRFVERRVRTRVALVAAVLAVATSLGLMGFAVTFGQLLACVALYSLGTMVVYPTQQTLTARLAPAGLTGSYFGFSAISLGLGGAVGNVVGGGLIDFSARIGLPLLPWLSLMGVGVLTALGLRWALREVPTREQTEQAAG
ncbi:MFS transporter [Deinococcus sp. MIMF12]|uniref:MFS transporter n=1 Tax=Deinococcus rhizophilus TaxID=3049544 RepID=A0ABT7JEI2_9DEIO|nr:MFS transporter [Deinococcus rhizophilus]MDL2342888.1 MFS transporter [Deinococcus rhizophilus]